MCITTGHIVSHIPDDKSKLPTDLVICKEEDEVYVNRQFVGRWTELSHVFKPVFTSTKD